MIFLYGNLLILAGLLVLTILALVRSGKLSAGVDIALMVVSVMTTIVVVLITLLTNNLLVASILMVLGVSLAARDSSRRDSLLWTLAMAAEQGLPLAPGVRAFAEECRGSYRRRVLSLARLLDQGTSLPAALDAVPNVLPDEGILAAKIGVQAGVLPQALHEAADRRTNRSPLWYSFGLRVLYLLAVLVITEAVLGFFLMFIVPKLRKIVADYGLELTGLAAGLVDFSQFCNTYAFLGIPILLVQGAIVLYLMLLLLGWVPWHPPLVRRLTWRLDSATILRMLALSVESGQPLSTPLAALAASYPRRAIRKKLARVEADVRAGQVWCESLYRRGLLDQVDLAVLESAGRAGNLTWALREMADGCERRLGYRMQAWAQILFPVAVLTVAVPIGLTAVAFFLPIIEIMKASA